MVRAKRMWKEKMKRKRGAVGSLESALFIGE